jgi:hypothetical protein
LWTAQEAEALKAELQGTGGDCSAYASATARRDCQGAELVNRIAASAPVPKLLSIEALAPPFMDPTIAPRFAARRAMARIPVPFKAVIGSSAL